MDSIPATPETHPFASAPSTIGRLEAGSIGAAVATIPALLIALPIAVRSFGGGGISPDASLSLRAANAVLLTAPVLLVTVAVVLSFAARPLGVRIGTAEAVRLTSTAIALVAAAVFSFSLLAALSVVGFASAMLAMSPLVAGFSVYAEPTISSGIWASTVIVGLSAMTSLATTQRKIEVRETDSPDSATSALLLLPCLILPLMLLCLSYLPAGATPPAILATVLAPPVVSISLFASAFVTARRKRSADDFATLRLAGRCMFICAAELSCVANFLGQANLC